MQRGATTSEQQISIHALREEGDFDQVVQFSERLVNFYPRPPRGGRRNHDAEKIHQSRISIHALREEGDVHFDVRTDKKYRFLSTPSARRATTNLPVDDRRNGFLSTPSARRATRSGTSAVGTLRISIHALREEGDPAWERQKQPRYLFLSTPSARRATF